MTDLIVIGGGIMGAPAAFHAAAAGADVIAIAPSEPKQRSGHDGVFGAHYDQSRIFWLLDPDPVDAELARRSLDLIRDIETSARSEILRSSGMLFAAAQGIAPSHLDTAAGPAGLAAGAEVVTAAEIMTRWPALDLPDDVAGYWEPAPAGILDPRTLVAAYLAAARERGCEVIDDHAVAIDVSGPTIHVHTASGRRLSARRVLVATGAYTQGLLGTGQFDRRLALRVKTETVVFAHLPDDQAERFADLPPLLYNPAHVGVHPGDVAELYATPLRRSPKGVWRLKLGANTSRDRWLADPGEISDWYRRPPMPSALPLLRRALLTLIPELDVREWRTERCAITYTPHRRPMVGAVVPDRVFVATGGNGHAAKAGAALGELAARLTLSGTWQDDGLEPHAFRIVWEDEPVPWSGAELLADRTS